MNSFNFNLVNRKQLSTFTRLYEGERFLNSKIFPKFELNFSSKISFYNEFGRINPKSSFNYFRFGGQSDFLPNSFGFEGSGLCINHWN